MKKLGFLLLFTLVAVFSLNAAQNIRTDSVPQNTDSSYRSLDEDQRQTLLMQKLSPEQLYELEKVRSETNPAHDGPTPTGIVIICLMAFATPVLIVFFVLHNKRRKEERMFQLYEKAMDAGKDLPDSFFKRPEEADLLQKGLIWTGVGLGVTIGGISLMGEHSPWAFGFIPVFVGVAYLISYFIDKKNKANKAQDE